MNCNNQQDNDRKEQTAIKIMQLLNLTAERYNAFKIRYGRAFLQNYFSRYPQLVDEILKKEVYWNWWEDQYLIRDELFLHDENIHRINTQILGAMYSTIHNPYSLAAELVVDRVVFEGLTNIPKPIV